MSPNPGGEWHGGLERQGLGGARARESPMGGSRCGGCFAWRPGTAPRKKAGEEEEARRDVGEGRGMARGGRVPGEGARRRGDLGSGHDGGCWVRPMMRGEVGD